MEKKKNKWKALRHSFREYASLSGQVDTDDAAQRIRNSIWFRGPNVWILAFSIIIASVGLNVNSTAVIIGAMLISPLMGPIIGMGLSLGTNDTNLLWDATRNLLVMVAISLGASTLFFLLSPLDLVNPTELEARTSPSIYDVLIALFGGLAGILENARKERGTVLSGVAIATALMPPLCTAGYGLANLDGHYFFGAMFLFVINAVFIILATYVMVKYLHFRTVSGIDAATALKRRRLMSGIILAVLIPSIWTAVGLVQENNFERNLNAFVRENRIIAHHYIYDYDIHGKTAELYMAGDAMDDAAKQELLDKAADYHLRADRIHIRQRSFGLTQRQMEDIIEQVYEHTDREMALKDAQMGVLMRKIDSLSAVVSALTVPPAEEMQ